MKLSSHRRTCTWCCEVCPDCQRS